MEKTLTDIANDIQSSAQNIHLIYAFNAIGKTRLSVEYKEFTRDENHNLTGFYYNAFSEDLFVWDNEHLQLTIKKSALNPIHSQISEDKIKEKLLPYKPKYDFSFNYHIDSADGIESISFFLQDENIETPIKISRGEERIFVWCFFLTLLDNTEGINDNQTQYIFIDDPISSVDEHNIFTTVFSLYDLVLKYYEKRKIIITTHHIALATILSDWLSKGENKDRFAPKNKPKYSIKLLEFRDNSYQLLNPKNGVLLYHLRILQIIKDAIDNDTLEMYHLAMVRQILENISSFLGCGRFSYVLQVIGYSDSGRITDIVNTLTHKNIYYPQMNAMPEDNKNLIKEIFTKLKEQFKFYI